MRSPYDRSILYAADIGTAVFGALCAVGGVLVLVFRREWHQRWWAGSRSIAPDDAQFERGVYRWGTIAFGIMLAVLGAGLALSALRG
jgi:hypothetical protein